MTPVCETRQSSWRGVRRWCGALVVAMLALIASNGGRPPIARANPTHVWIVNQHVVDTLAGGAVDLRAPTARAGILSQLDAMEAASGHQVPQTASAAVQAGETWIVVQNDGSLTNITLNGRGIDCATHVPSGPDDGTAACDGVTGSVVNPVDDIAVYEIADAGLHSPGDALVVTAVEDAVTLDSEQITVVGQATNVSIAVGDNKTAVEAGAPTCAAGDSTSDPRRALALGTYTDAGGRQLAGYLPSFGSSNGAVLAVAAAAATSMARPDGVTIVAADVVCGGVSGMANVVLTTAAGDLQGNSGTVQRQQAITVFGAFAVTTTADSGAGSLRQAILDANALGTISGITFDISPGGAKSIVPTTALPPTTSPVVIDGTTQPGFAGTPLIEIQGGLAVEGGGSTIRGLVINNGPLVLETNGNNVVRGNFIGTDASGTASGGFPCCPPAPALEIGSFSSGNQIGGTTAADRNVISGSLHDFEIDFMANDNVVQGNYIGVDVTGTSGVPTGGGGGELLNVGSDGNTIGGTALGAGNVIGGLSDSTIGVLMQGSGNTVQGNLIGTNAAGIAALPNGIGVSMTQGTNNLIGGTVPTARNVISGNQTGMYLQAAGNTVEGNFIGVGASGNMALGNQFDGVAAEGDATVGPGNIIAHNGRYGVGVFNGNNNQVLGSAIFANAGGGIVLQPGSNNGELPPLLTSTSSDGGVSTIQGGFSGAPNATYEVDFFSDLSCDPSGSGQGRVSLGSVSVLTDGGGSGTFSPTVTVGVTPGQIVSATVTDPSGNTSEFSACQVVTSSQYCAIRRADINFDGVVNGLDLAKMAAGFTKPVPVAGVRVDLNGDGIVNGVDLSAFASKFTHFSFECP